MFNRTSDQQTLNTLRTLHDNGMLSQDEGLDDQIAADLLSGATSADQMRSTDPAFASLTQDPMSKKRETPIPLSPINRSAADKSSAAPVDDYWDDAASRRRGQNVSEELLKQLGTECDTFSTKLTQNTVLAQELMKKGLAELFVTTAQEKLPDCFLRSLPKFGKGANQITGLFNRSLNKKKTDNLIDRKEVPFELQLQEDVLDELNGDIETVVEGELHRCFGVMGQDITKIIRTVARVKTRMEHLEEQLLHEQTESRVLAERLKDEKEQMVELDERIQSLTEQARDKETQMDILSDQVKRRNQMLDEQRNRFQKEVMRYKTRIYELQHRLEQTGGEGRRHSFGANELDLTPANQSAMDSIEVVEAVDSATRDLREQMLENIRKLKADHAREKKELLHQKKLAIDERDNDIYHLKMSIKSMDRIIEVEKRRLMKNREQELKELQEKYEQKISALQAEIQQLRNELQAKGK
eukprot:NODE_942_length_1542_cov_61.100353_g931_i0.p1 GENE.NODE_942_length_1542_cov_61.100353_g931_i0~~NODE_942_length_1542_cov_61.100353_g931_i0.p1  ORF type:complete len:469 (-),score=94.87 NODE_942_length_1542_cov_61.100353_g931_i0:43-1449(-)